MNLNPIANIDKVQPAELATGPVVVLNLLKFKPGDSLKRYLEYAARVWDAFDDVGLEVICAGYLKEQIQGDVGDWDAVLLARYPSRQICYEVFRSDKYQAISHLREDALDNGVLWPFEPVLPYKTQTIDFEGGECLDLIQSGDS